MTISSSKYSSWLRNKEKKRIPSVKLTLIIIQFVRQNRNNSSMFQNSYQNGTYFDLLDLKANQQKLKPLFKTTNTLPNNKIFDKELKTYVLQFSAANSKMHLPKDEKKDLYLIQQYLVLQIYVFPGMAWNIELTISDLTKTKRRIMLSPTTHKLEIKPFFLKYPFHNFSEGVWNNLVIDLHSYIEAFKGQTYRSLDSISITGHFKLRRIYTASTQPIEFDGQNQSQEIQSMSFLPKNYYFPPGVAYSTKVTKFSWEVQNQTISEASEPTVKHQPIRNSKPRTGPSIPRLQKNQSFKTEKNIKSSKDEVRYGSSKKKDFLSNTNGTEMVIRNRKKQQVSDNDFSDGNPSSNYNKKDTKSVDKNSKKKQLTKTQQIPPKPRTSLEGYNVVPKKGKPPSKSKNKVNPWRSTKVSGGNTDVSQLGTSKHEDQRNIGTSQTASMLKTKNFGSRFTDTKNLGFDKRSDHYSENQYVELSQKFSTLTDGKFFKNELGSNQQLEQKNEGEDQIEQNIEMETNSVHSNSEKKEKVQRITDKKRGTIEQEPINESIVDSLDHFVDKNKQKMQLLCRESQYGFGQQLMNRFMGEIQRPYSPPIGERQVTEQSTTEHHDAKEEVELIYDPVLNCYYDHRTHTYYELKN